MALEIVKASININISNRLIDIMNRWIDRFKNTIAFYGQTTRLVLLALLILASVVTDCLATVNADDEFILPASPYRYWATGGDIYFKFKSEFPQRLVFHLNGKQVAPILSDPSNTAFHALDLPWSFSPSIKAGFLSGLVIGKNQLTIDDGAKKSTLLIENFSAHGPIISGPHRQPFLCQTDQFKLYPSREAATLGPAVNDSCDIATRFDLYYLDQQARWRPLGDEMPTNLRVIDYRSQSLPLIIQVETGTLNRGIYQIATLVSVKRVDHRWQVVPQFQQLAYRFGGGCQKGWYRQGEKTAGVFHPYLIEKGFAVASSSLNVFGVNCDDLLSSETVLIVKEHFIEQYGEPKYTLGLGCSGGAYQSLLTADNYPGLLDGILVGCTIADVIITALNPMIDSLLLRHYFEQRQLDWQENQILAVSGFANIKTLEKMSAAAARINPMIRSERPGGELIGYDLNTVYDPKANPNGIRATVYDHAKHIYQVDELGRARRPYSNIGVQYGLHALQQGDISPRQFLDLNTHIGGVDIDANFTSERSTHDPVATEAAYQSGRILDGGGGLGLIPIVDYRAYTDEKPTGDIHLRFFSDVLSTRLIQQNGSRGNLVQLIEDGDCPDCATFSFERPLLRYGLMNLMQWIENLQTYRRRHRQAVSPQSVAQLRPMLFSDGCWIDGNRVDLVDAGAKALCDQRYPSYRPPRQMAGAGAVANRVACQLRPINIADYPDPQADFINALQQVFPKGVCDWQLKGQHQSPLTGIWQRF